MGRSVVISDNDRVHPSHKSSEERLREDTARVQGSLVARFVLPAF